MGGRTSSAASSLIDLNASFMTAACSVCSAPAFSRLLSILNAVGDAGSTCHGAGRERRKDAKKPSGESMSRWLHLRRRRQLRRAAATVMQRSLSGQTEISDAHPHVDADEDEGGAEGLRRHNGGLGRVLRVRKVEVAVVSREQYVLALQAKAFGAHPLPHHVAVERKGRATGVYEPLAGE